MIILRNSARESDFGVGSYGLNYVLPKWYARVLIPISQNVIFFVNKIVVADKVKLRQHHGHAPNPV